MVSEHYTNSGSLRQTPRILAIASVIAVLIGINFIECTTILQKFKMDVLRVTKLKDMTQILTTTPTQNVEHSIFLGAINETFCVPWDVNMDDWWTHKVDWEAAGENDTHYCFSPIEDSRKAQYFRELYNIQFHGNCSNVFIKKMISSGWGADMMHVFDGLHYAKLNNRPMQLHTWVWQYVVDAHNRSNAVCESKDMFCYFIDFVGCDVDITNFTKAEIHGNRMAPIFEMLSELGMWYREFANRQRAWLRREVYEYAKTKINITTPCTAIHVRRSDVVLHQKRSRRYHAIEEYVDAMQDKSTRNILLLTDDQNAIGEAHAKYPDKNWMYFDRPRHKGAEGGFENQIPSKDPKLEVIILLAIFRTVKQCKEFIHSTSGFSDLLRLEMETALSSNSTMFRSKDLDKGVGFVRSRDNMQTVNISRSYETY